MGYTLSGESIFEVEARDEHAVASICLHQCGVNDRERFRNRIARQADGTRL